MSHGRQMALSLGSCLLGAAVTLVATGQPWARGEAVQGDLQLSLRVTGSSLASLTSALAVAGLAGGLALLAVHGRVRAGLGVCLLACGLGAAVVAAGNARPGAEALGGRAGDALGIQAAAARNVSATGWPWVAVAGALLLAFGGAVAAGRGASWPGMSARYSRRTENGSDPVGAAAPVNDGSLDQWRALDRGEDPSLRPPSEGVSEPG